MSPSKTNPSDLRQQVVDTARQSVERGLNQGSSGNVSLRCGEGLLITPSGLATDALGPNDIVYVPFEGEAEGDLPPSSEWRFHRDIYVHRPEANAVVHAHSPFAVSLACLRKGIPSFHYMVAVAGGADIRCADYATFGTQALSDHVVQALEGRRACLMANHGLVAFGETAERALYIALEVEALCEQFWRASLLGAPVLLTEAEMAEAIERFKTYGKR
jgi:L-fuculose-phosphate aldolase